MVVKENPGKIGLGRGKGGWGSLQKFAPENRILFYSFALDIYVSVITSFRLITCFSSVETVQQCGAE